MKKKHNSLLEIVIYLVAYILFFAFGFLLLIFILNTFKRPFLVEGESFITVVGVVASTLLAVVALRQSQIANHINTRLVDLESSRDLLELRPFVLISNGRAGMVQQHSILEPHQKLMIDIGGGPFEFEKGYLEYYGLNIEYINSTDYPLRLHFDSMVSKDKKDSWSNCVTNNGRYGITLKSGESAEILFYGDKSKFTNPSGYEMKLILENRFTDRYIETVTIYIMGYSAGRENSPDFVQLRSQNYCVEKI